MFRKHPIRNVYHNWIHNPRTGLRGVKDPIGSDHYVIGTVPNDLLGLFNLIFTRH